ncbi:MAG TPA: pirin-like C-terminal cupin domain-containing protein, partial [Polyangiaceae bacterium]|nr:pirin-like C-terminal cupin domain-containing protein [Polyangiaceae bacterium]
LDIQLRAGEQVPVRLPGSYNALAVVVEGRLRAGQRSASAGELVLFANDGELVALDAEEDAHVILLSGEPINEPIVQYGPFVMNSVQEIRQAMLDVSQGKFGTIPD